MKKYSIICIMLATVVLMCGCKKEKDFVTLSAVIDNPAKVYINGDNLPCWNVGDEIYINDRSYTLQSVDGSYAQIDGVTANDDDIYSAIYPASIVASGSDFSGSNSVAVTLDAIQTYREINGHQEVRVPMGAYISGGTTLQFHNLCSIVRVTISNPAPNSTKDGEGPGTEANEGDKLIQEIILKSSGTNPVSLSGTGTATITGVGTGANADKIVLSDGTPTVSLLCGGVVIAQGGESKSFDIFVPEFTNSNITITVNTDKGFVEATTSSAVSLNHNSIVTINANVANVTAYPAELLPGPQFNAQAASCAGSLSNIHNVVFEYNSTRSATNYEFQTAASTTPIYGSYANNTLTIFTAADKIYANSNCTEMFKNMGLTTTPDFDGYTTSTSTKDGQTYEYGDHFNAKHVTHMSGMFKNCTNLSTFNLGVFANTLALKNMREMFYGCSSLAAVTNTGYNGASSSFTTENVKAMEEMFRECTTLTSIPTLTTGNVISMNGMFYNCSSMVDPNIAGFNTAKVSNMEGMFYGCTNLTGGTSGLDLSGFNTENVTTMRGMFQNCSNLVTISLPSDNSKKHTKSVESMWSMFEGCSRLSTINNFSTFLNNDNSTVLWSTQNMFNNCSSLVSLVFPSTFNTGTVTNMYGMFHGCSGLTTLNISGFNTTNVRNMSAMFDGCSSLGTLTEANTGLIISSNFQATNVTNFQYMFRNCSGLKTLDLSNFFPASASGPTTSVDMSSMFYKCENLTTLTLTNFVTTHVTTMNNMFYNCKKLTSLDLSTFNTANVTNMADMFNSCSKLSTLDLHPSFSMAGVLGGLSSRTSFYGRMFKNLGSSVGGCTITCTNDVKTFFENDADSRGIFVTTYGYPNSINNAQTPSNVTFVVPSSKK